MPHARAAPSRASGRTSRTNRAGDAHYFRTVGLDELVDDEFARIGTRVVEPGSALGDGLTETAARDLGLPAGTPVGAGLIDAHAGGVGTVGAEGAAGSVLTRMAYVLGTSACSMATTVEPAFVDGVWGPYRSAMVPGRWLNEGGQSAAGAALDHLVRMHPAARVASAKAEAANVSLVAWLGTRAAERCDDGIDALALAGRVHVLPEFLGNRSPHADPDARAVIAGTGPGRRHRRARRSVRRGAPRHRVRRAPAGGGARRRGRRDRHTCCQRRRGAAATSCDERSPTPPVSPSRCPRRPSRCCSAARFSRRLQAKPIRTSPPPWRRCRRFGAVIAPAGGAVADAHARRYAAFRRMQRLDRELRELD